MRRVNVGISCGDIAGIGLEVIAKAVREVRSDTVKISVYAPDGVWKHLPPSVFAPAVELVNIGHFEQNIVVGQPNAASAQWAYKSLQAASDDVWAGKQDVLVTAPIDKQRMDSIGFPFPGHTEYLAERCGNPPHLMLLVSDNLRVGTVTGHIPLREVAKCITSDAILAKLLVMHTGLQRDFGIQEPNIAVLGLNPHAGDNGRLGHEEEHIRAALDRAKEQGLRITGPLPADGFFGSRQYQQFDAILAMYHDQGLVPFKTLSFGNGVNYTAGLPVVRTSPDHGTAFNIAGKGIADGSSMAHAIELGATIWRKRARQ